MTDFSNKDFERSFLKNAHKLKFDDCCKKEFYNKNKIYLDFDSSGLKYYDYTCKDKEGFPSCSKDIFKLYKKEENKIIVFLNTIYRFLDILVILILYPFDIWIFVLLNIFNFFVVFQVSGFKFKNKKNKVIIYPKKVKE